VQIAPATKTTLLLLSMMTMMSNVAIITSLPHLKDHFPHVDAIEFYSRLMITLPSLSIALLAPFLGHLLHGISRRASITGGLLIFALTGSAGLYLQGIESLLVSRALFGVAVAVLMIVTTALVGDYFTQEQRHRYMGLQSAFTSLGGLLLLVSGGLLSDIGWRYPFAVYLLGLLYIPLVRRFIIEPRHPAHGDAVEEPDAKLTGIYALAFLLMLLFYILPTQMPFLMINHFGASGILTGSIIATAFIANALGAMSFSRLKKRFGFGQIYLIGMAVVGIGFVLIGLVRDVHLFFLTSPIMGFGGGVLMTNVMAWMLSRSHSRRRVKSSGYLASSLFMGQFFSPILFHPAVVHFGVQHFFVVVGGVLLAGAGSAAAALKLR
jgi:MFS family permease